MQETCLYSALRGAYSKAQSLLLEWNCYVNLRTGPAGATNLHRAMQQVGTLLHAQQPKAALRGTCPRGCQLIGVEAMPVIGDCEPYPLAFKAQVDPHGAG